MSFRSESWMQDAICRQVDPELFFPSYDNPATVSHITAARNAKAICSSCPVQLQCLDAALRRNERHGIWGGVNMGSNRAAMRDEMRRQRGISLDRSEFDEHGGPTDAGARRHYRRGEKPCQACAESAIRYARERRA